MSSSLYARATAIIAIAATLDLSGKEGRFYKLDGDNQAVIVSAATDIPDGLILAVRADGLEISAAPFGGNHGTVRVKLGGDVTDLRKKLTLKADGTAEQDDGSGAAVFVAKPLETGDTDELVECVLLHEPRVVALAPALTSTNGTFAAAADLAAAKAEGENVGDDVRALHAAALAAGAIRA